MRVFLSMEPFSIILGGFNSQVQQSEKMLKILDLAF